MLCSVQYIIVETIIFLNLKFFVLMTLELGIHINGVYVCRNSLKVEFENKKYLPLEY